MRERERERKRERKSEKGSTRMDMQEGDGEEGMSMQYW